VFIRFYCFNWGLFRVRDIDVFIGVEKRAADAVIGHCANDHDRRGASILRGVRMDNRSPPHPEFSALSIHCFLFLDSFLLIAVPEARVERVLHVGVTLPLTGAIAEYEVVYKNGFDSP